MIKFTGSIPDGWKYRTLGHSQTSGPYTEYVYEGPEFQMLGVFNSAAGIVDDVSLDQEGPLHRCRVRINQLPDEAGEEVPEVDVRMEEEEHEKDIREHDAFSDLSQSQMDTVNKAIFDTSTSTNVSGLPVAAQEIILLAKKGVKSKIVYQPTLIRVATSSRRYIWDISYANCGKIIGINRIVSDAGIEDRLKVKQLPNDTTLRADFLYGWLKGYPSQGPASGGKFVLTQKYRYGLWSTKLYPDPVI